MKPRSVGYLVGGVKLDPVVKRVTLSGLIVEANAPRYTVKADEYIDGFLLYDNKEMKVISRGMTRKFARHIAKTLNVRS